MMSSKKGQFVILTSMILLVTGIIIYSQETVNTYKNPEHDFYILESLEKEVCALITITNGTNLPVVIPQMETDTGEFCSKRGLNCLLEIKNTTQVPFNGNWSMHNYSYYNYTLALQSNYLNYSNTFTC